MRIYDCRHAAATTWLRAGMPLAETARRLGHSVETLVSTYVGALDDEEHVASKQSTQSSDRPQTRVVSPERHQRRPPDDGAGRIG